ncbi:hypothetical protein QVD17_19068 [Tagetes erecta]|uniref:Uncharacterized protein n=1 Tax=Tagetes erecta TaxID=13708 RepID=A0AAD8KQA5_TARER|nr:hypothetical protein QVD17_19068 [Tagetes erecta]
MDVVAKWKRLSRSVLHQRIVNTLCKAMTLSAKAIIKSKSFTVVKVGSGCKNKATNQQGLEWLKKYMKLSSSSLNVLTELTLMTALQKESPLNPRRNMQTHGF